MNDSTPEPPKLQALFPPGTYASIPKELLADGDMSPADKLVYLGLASHLSANKSQVWPGAVTLARATGLSRRGVQNSIRALIRAGWAAMTSAGGPVGPNGRRTNLYTLNGWRTACASAQNAPLPDSAQNAPPMAHRVRGDSAQNAPEVLQRRTPIKNTSSSAAGKPPPDPRVSEFITWFCEAYQKATGQKYVVTGAKDGASVKRMLKAMEPDELRRAAQNMLADEWGRSKADIGLLVSQVNRWRQAPRAEARRGKYQPATADLSVYDRRGGAGDGR